MVLSKSSWRRARSGTEQKSRNDTPGTMARLRPTTFGIIALAAVLVIAAAVMLWVSADFKASKAPRRCSRRAKKSSLAGWKFNRANGAQCGQRLLPVQLALGVDFCAGLAMLCQRNALPPVNHWTNQLRRVTMQFSQCRLHALKIRILRTFTRSFLKGQSQVIWPGE